MRTRAIVLAAAVVALTLHADTNSDLAAARAVFDANLAAIRNHDAEGYKAVYLHSNALVRTGPEGLTTGYDDFAGRIGRQWPDSIEANDVHLTPLQPGMVYGTYRYRVRYGAEEHTGISERLFVKTDGGWRIALTGAVDAPPGTPPPPRALVHATLIDGRGGLPLHDANVILRDGKIDCAGSAAQCPPAGVDVTDAGGMWVTPGLIDAHVHFSQTGWADGRPDSLDVRSTHPYESVEADLKANPERYARSYVCSGVTSVFDVGGYPWTLQLAKRFEHDTLAPHVVAAGPLLSTLDHWLNLPAERQFIHLHDEATARDGVRYLAAEGSKAIKVWYIVRPPELPVEKSAAAVMTAGQEAHKRGLPLIVHATGLNEAKASLRAGANVLVHSVDDQEVDDELIDLARRNGTIVIPTLTVVDGYVRMYHGVVDRKAPAVDDPNGCVDRDTLAKVAETATVDPALVKPDRLQAREERARRADIMTRGNLAKLVQAGIPIATGTDAGNPLTLHGPAIYAEMEAMEASGMTPMQVIVASTATAARAAGLDQRTGTIEKGKDADLVIVAADPAAHVSNFRRIRYVVRGGVVRSIEELSALAQGAPRKP